MNNSLVWSKLGQIMVLQAFEEQPGAGTAASPPVLLLPPCPGRGRAGTGPGGRPWLCWWSSRRVGRTSGVLPALQKTPNHETQPSQPRAALSWSGPTSHTPAGFVTPNISQVVSQHHPRNRATNVTCRAALQQTGAAEGLGAPASPQPCLSLQLPTHPQL